MLNMAKLTRISVAEVARIMSTTPYTVREAVRNKELPIGFVKKGDEKDTFIIYREWLEKYLIDRGGLNEAHSNEEPHTRSGLELVSGNRGGSIADQLSVGADYCKGG